MKRFQYSLYIFLLIGTCTRVSGQQGNQSSDLKQVLTPSPTASALGQYGNTPVGLYTGSAQVNVPLYEIKEGSLTLPISLSYNSGGIKVADMASWVGLGFALNAGGCITRTIYGSADENNRTSPTFSMPSHPTSGQIKEGLIGNVDYQPDVFYFNFNGKSGKFTLSNTSTISIAPHQNLKIQVYDNNDSVMNPPFYVAAPLMFRITDENGIVYEFTDYETNRSVNFNPDVIQSPIVGGIGVPLAKPTAWYLTDMYSPTGDTIRFIYGTYGLTYDLPSSEQQFVFMSGQSIDANVAPTQLNFVKNATRCLNVNKRLQEIVFSNGYVVFSAGQARKDLVGDTALAQMMVFRKDGSPVKGYSFKYGYSLGGSGLIQDTTGPTSSMDNFYASYLENLSTSSNYRLMLTGISELDNNFLADGRNYSFTYNLYAGGLPSRFSTQRDWWGYYNANGYTSSNFMTYQLTGPSSDPNSYLITGKEPDSNYCGLNTLQKITYPTGGYTQFNYELHSAYVGKGVLPPVVTAQQVQIAIDFSSYPNGYTDTTINGLDCVYKIFSFSSDTGASANITISNIMYQQGLHPLLRFDIYDSTNQVFLSMNDLEGNVATTTTYIDNTVGGQTYRAYTYTLTNYHFPHGTYKVIFFPIASFIGTNTYLTDYLHQPSFQMTGWSTITYNTDSIDISRYIGGLRIRSILDYDPVSNKYQEKDYAYTQNNSSLSSGTIVSGQSYLYALTEFLNTTVTLPGGFTQDYSAYYYYAVLNSESNYALSTTQGSNVGYSTVTETDINPITGVPNGKSEYHYTSPSDFPDYYGSSPGPADNFPYPPPDARDWQRGFLKQRTDYSYSNGEFSPVKIENNTYGSPIYVDTALGYIGRYVVEVFPSIADTSSEVMISGDEFSNPEIFSGEPYYLTGGYIPLLSKSITMIQNGDSVTQTQNFAYADAPANMLPTSIASRDSKGNTNTAHFKYPFDYSLNSPVTSQGQGVLNLQQHHMLSPEVEKFVIKTSGAGGDLGAISGIYTTFKPSQTLPDTLFHLESPAPVVGYNPVSLSDAGSVLDPHYTSRVSFSSFDSYGNLLQQQKIGDITQSYVWDYYNKYPVAGAQNAQQSDIAYTSFEADGTGNWSLNGGTVDSTQAITGSSSYQNGTITRSGLNSATTYIVSYWSQNGAYNIPGTISGYPQQGKTVSFHTPGWTLYVHKVTGQSTITVNATGHIDELRLYPATAQMTTYTYDPLVGMTTQMDAGGRATYYEYDGLQRLKRVRDQDYNILKTIEYAYQAPGGCGGNCYPIAMQTFAGTTTLSYPVGVFNINGKLLGNAATPSAYTGSWNNDTADARVGSLALGADSMHFVLNLNAGQTLPASVTGCRYYQFDLNWNIIDGIRNFNGAYVDFGDGTGMRLGKNNMDTPEVIAPNTTYAIGGYTDHNTNVFRTQVYFIHSYSDTALKTLTLYHDDDSTNSALDNINFPATSLSRLSNLRGNLPQNTQWIGGSSYENASAMSVAQVANWNSISSVLRLSLQTGDGTQTKPNHVGYSQDFMKNNKGLQVVWIDQCIDTSFKMSRLKSDWNTYFTQIFWLSINDNEWNREDLSALTNLRAFGLSSTSTNGAGIIDSIINQIATGAGHYITNGSIGIFWPGYDRTAASAASYTYLKSRNWTITINGVYE